MSTTESPSDVLVTPLRRWFLGHQARSLPFSMYLQSIRTPHLTTAMKVASFTGTEDFYAALLMFCVWIVNGRLGLTIGYILCLGFCFTNVMKDILRFPRPPPPVKPLEKATDWGFPSHHTLMVTTLSLCMVNCLYNQGMIASHQIPWCISLCACWASLVGFSRLYIGVHSVADLAAGLVCGLLLTAFYITVEPHLDRYFVSDIFRWWHFAIAGFVLFMVYPIAQPATTTFLDCMVTLGGAAGCAIARARLRPDMFPSLFELPASSFANGVTPYICTFFRLAIGFTLVMALRQVCKKVVPYVLRPLLSNVWGEESIMQNVQRAIEAQPPFTHGNGVSSTWKQKESKAFDEGTRALLMWIPRISYLHDAVLRFVVYTVMSWSACEVMPMVFSWIGI